MIFIVMKNKMEMDEYVLKAKTTDGYSIKVLIDLLQCNIKTGNFKLTKDGITLCMIDSQKKILISLKLHAENFQSFKYNLDTDICVGINLLHLHKMLKSIKKKDSIELFMDKKKEYIGVKVMPRDSNRTTTSHINTQMIQLIDISMPSGYGKSHLISSSEYQKMCKDMNSIGQTMAITSSEDYIKFNCCDNNVYKREVCFGEEDDTSISYHELYDTDQLYRIIKLSGMSPHMNVYTTPNLPLLIKGKIGMLGEIQLYIKNKTQLNN